MFAEFGENVIESIMGTSPLAGKPAPASILVNVPRLVTAYDFAEEPDPSVPAQRVAFGTSGRRGPHSTRPSTNGTSSRSLRRFVYTESCAD